MFPTIPIGPLRLQTHGLFLLAAYFAGLWLATRQARRYGIDGDHVANAGLYALIAGLLSARVGHAVAFFEVYRTDPLQILSLSAGAFLLLPGLLGALAMTAIYVRRHRLPAATIADSFAPGVLLGIAIAEVGGFLSGNSLGATSQLPWAVVSFGVSRHPTGMYGALATLALLALLLRIDRTRTLRPGQLALMTVFGCATIVLFLTPLRAESPLVGDGWRLPQLIALAVVAICGWMLGRRWTDGDGRATADGESRTAEGS